MKSEEIKEELTKLTMRKYDILRLRNEEIDKRIKEWSAFMVKHYEKEREEEAKRKVLEDKEDIELETEYKRLWDLLRNCR